MTLGLEAPDTVCTVSGASVWQASSHLLRLATHPPRKFAAQQLRHIGFYSSQLAQPPSTLIHTTLIHITSLPDGALEGLSSACEMYTATHIRKQPVGEVVQAVHQCTTSEWVDTLYHVLAAGPLSPSAPRLKVAFQPTAQNAWPENVHTHQWYAAHTP